MPLKVLRAIDIISLLLRTLTLKVSMPVICLRNLFPNEGLYNGSRGVVISLGRNSIEIRILNRDHDRKL